MNKYDSQLQLLMYLKHKCMESYTITSKPSTNTPTTCDTPSIKVTIREVVIWSHFINILKNVSCDYDGWVVETQLCKLPDM